MQRGLHLNILKYIHTVSGNFRIIVHLLPAHMTLQVTNNYLTEGPGQRLQRFMGCMLKEAGEAKTIIFSFSLHTLHSDPVFQRPHLLSATADIVQEYN